MLARCGAAVWIGLAVMLIASVSQGATDLRVVWDWGANLLRQIAESRGVQIPVNSTKQHALAELWR